MGNKKSVFEPAPIVPVQCDVKHILLVGTCGQSSIMNRYCDEIVSVGNFTVSKIRHFTDTYMYKYRYINTSSAEIRKESGLWRDLLSTCKNDVLVMLCAGDGSRFDNGLNQFYASEIDPVFKKYPYDIVLLSDHLIDSRDDQNIIIMSHNISIAVSGWYKRRFQSCVINLSHSETNDNFIKFINQKHIMPKLKSN